MTKETLEQALNKVVTVEFKNSDAKYFGWLVKGLYKGNHYEILPIDYKAGCLIVFTPSHVKSITYDSNGVVLK